MKELTDLFTECLDHYNKCVPCDGNTCQLGFFCSSNNCIKGQCDRCLNHIQWAIAPQFHYACPKITYHYVLRFFNRFASEIAYVMASMKNTYLQNRSRLNVVSLGCGPGSEVFGIIKALRVKAPQIVLNYQGFDLNTVWQDVQLISKTVLSQTSHAIEFYNMNMFGAFNGFDNGVVDLLVLNYLMSDSQKYYHLDSDKIKFIEEIAQFVLAHNVKNILFNDNSFYGKGALDSGVGMMLRLIVTLRKWGLNPTSTFRCFPSDSFVPTHKWVKYDYDKLVFKPFPCNTFDTNITCCKSKQILVHIS